MAASFTRRTCRRDLELEACDWHEWLLEVVRCSAPFFVAKAEEREREGKREREGGAGPGWVHVKSGPARAPCSNE